MLSQFAFYNNTDALRSIEKDKLFIIKTFLNEKVFFQQLFKQENILSNNNSSWAFIFYNIIYFVHYLTWNRQKKRKFVPVT